MKQKQPRKTKYEDLYVISGKITVVMADKSGKTIGTTELLLKDVWIKTPKIYKNWTVYTSEKHETKTKKTD